MNYKEIVFNDLLNNDYTFARLDDYEDDKIEQNFTAFVAQQYLFNILTFENSEEYNFDVFLNTIKEVPLSQEHIQIILTSCENQLVYSKNALTSEQEIGDKKEFFRNIMIRIFFILDCLPKNSMEIKNAIVESISLEIILEFAFNFPDDKITRNITSIFLSLLDIENEEESESNKNYLSKFIKFFPHFQKLYIDVKMANIIKVLDIFIYLTQVPTFLSFFSKKIYMDEGKIIFADEMEKSILEKKKSLFVEEEKTILIYPKEKPSISEEDIILKKINEESFSIVDDIIDMVESNDNKILSRVLTFTYLVMKEDFDKGFKNVNRYVKLLGKGSEKDKYYDDPYFVEVVCQASRIVRYIIKYEINWIPSNEIDQIVIHLFENAQNSKLKNKILFLKCLITLAEKYNFEQLSKLFEKSFGSFLAEFLDYNDDDEIILKVLYGINMIADKEMESKGTVNILNEFLDNGGYIFFEEYQSNGDNEYISNEIDVILQKVKSD